MLHFGNGNDLPSCLEIVISEFLFLRAETYFHLVPLKLHGRGLVRRLPWPKLGPRWCWNSSSPSDASPLLRGSRSAPTPSAASYGSWWQISASGQKKAGFVIRFHPSKIFIHQHHDEHCACRKCERVITVKVPDQVRFWHENVLYTS